MKFESFGNKPESVKKAIHEGDKKTLSDMGKKGAEVANEIKKDKKDKSDAINDYWSEKSAKDEAGLKESTNENIVPFDSDVI